MPRITKLKKGQGMESKGKQPAEATKPESSKATTSKEPATGPPPATCVILSSRGAFPPRWFQLNKLIRIHSTSVAQKRENEAVPPHHKWNWMPDAKNVFATPLTKVYRIEPIDAVLMATPPSPLMPNLSFYEVLSMEEGARARGINITKLATAQAFAADPDHPRYHVRDNSPAWMSSRPNAYSKSITTAVLRFFAARQARLPADGAAATKGALFMRENGLVDTHHHAAHVLDVMIADGVNTMDVDAVLGALDAWYAPFDTDPDLWCGLPWECARWPAAIPRKRLLQDPDSAADLREQHLWSIVPEPRISTHVPPPLRQLAKQLMYDDGQPAWKEVVDVAFHEVCVRPEWPFFRSSPYMPWGS